MRARAPSKKLIAGVIGMLLFMTAAVIIVLPYNYKWYVLHRYLMIPSRLILGWAWFLMIEVGFVFRVRWLEVVYVVVAAVSGFLFGGLIYILWTKHWIFKILVVILLLLQLLFGTFITLFAGYFVESPEEVCQVAVTEDISLKILYYDHGGGGNYFVLSTVDEGETWQQSMVQQYDSWDDGPPPPDCEGQVLQFQTLPNNQLVWMWANRNFSVSNDGGRTWETWQSSCGIRERCDYGSISTVNFEDSERGHMEVFTDRDGSTTDIYSSDGGLSWGSEPNR